MNYLAASGEVSCHVRTFLSGIHKSKGSRPSSGQIPAENMPRRGRDCVKIISQVFELNPRPLLLQREGAISLCIQSPSLFKRGI